MHTFAPAINRTSSRSPRSAAGDTAAGEEDASKLIDLALRSIGTFGL
jgi:hypothetical protein